MTIADRIVSLGGANTKSSRKGGSARDVMGLIISGVLLVSFFITSSAWAGFDRVFFSVNGDTTLTAMTQGDELFWGSSCDTGTTINWEIWYDANSNSTVEPTVDFLLTSENMTDGNVLTEPDAVLDGYVIAAPIVLSGEPGAYIFKATDIGTDSSLWKILTMVAMSSPPNQLTGQITLPGVSAPNSLLANKSVFAEAEIGDDGAYFGMTDNMGMYSMNIGASGTGVEFTLWPSNVSGFVIPEEISAIASGVVGNNDFMYTAAVDSIWGFVKDELGTIINFETNLLAGSGFLWRNTTTSGGRYVIYFSSTDNSNWGLEFDSRISPLYLTPDQFYFNLDTLSSFQHDVILTGVDTVIYARVTEDGGLPVNNYRVYAYSALLASGTEAVFGTGSDNIAILHVSSLDPSDWYVWINQYDDEFPIPVGLNVSGDVSGVASGDTVILELIAGKLMSGTVTQDPEDDPILWENVFVAAGLYGARTDMGGTYSFYADTGTYYMEVYADGYLANPQVRTVHLTTDIFSGLDFIINKTHCRVEGALTNLTLPLDNPFYTVLAHTGSGNSDGYYVSTQVDRVTGTYQLDLCDGTWTIDPPSIFGYNNPPGSATITIGETPDTVRTVDFVYNEDCCAGRVGDINSSGDDEPTIGDIAILIDVLYISLNWTQVGCMTEADINQSGGTNPVGGEGGDITIGDVSLLIDALFITNDWTQLPNCL